MPQPPFVLQPPHESRRGEPLDLHGGRAREPEPPPDREPRQGEGVISPLRVSGYSRNFEASNTIMLRASSGKVLSRRTVLSNDWSETWGYFEASIGFPAFEGQGTLRVGSVSPRDGTFEGVEVPVIYGTGG